MTTYGTTYIDISARLDKLDEGLKEAVGKAVSYGEQVGKAFGVEMEGSMLSEVQQAADEAMSALKSEFKEAETDLREAGEKAGEAYASGFNTGAQQASPAQQIGGAAGQRQAISSGRMFGQTFFGQVANQWGQGGAAKLAGVFAKQLGPMAVANLADGIADFIRSDKSIGEAANDALRGIPFVGSFVNLGNALYEEMFESGTRAAEEMIAKAEAARAGILAGRAAAAKEEQESLGRLDSLRVDQQRLVLAQQLRDLQREASDEDKVRFKAQHDAIQLERDLQFALAADISEAERTEMERNHALRLAEIEDRAASEIDGIRRRMEEEASLEAERRRQEEERLQREEEQREATIRGAREELQLAEIRLKALRDGKGASEEMLAMIAESERTATEEIRKQRELRNAQTEEEREAIESRYEVESEIARLQASAGDAQKKAAAAAEGAATALGGFKFDPYPPREMRQVQERTMKAVEKTASAMASGGLGFQ